MLEEYSHALTHGDASVVSVLKPDGRNSFQGTNEMFTINLTSSQTVVQLYDLASKTYEGLY